MQEIAVPAGSIQYFYEKPGLPSQENAVDPTTGTVEFALAPAGVTPAGGDFEAGEWFIDPFGKVWARVLLGSTLTLAVGIFDVWIRPEVGAELAARVCARLYIA